MDERHHKAESHLEKWASVTCDRWSHGGLWNINERKSERESGVVGKVHEYKECMQINVHILFTETQHMYKDDMSRFRDVKQPLSPSVLRNSWIWLHAAAVWKVCRSIRLQRRNKAISDSVSHTVGDDLSSQADGFCLILRTQFLLQMDRCDFDLMIFQTWDRLKGAWILCV